jgi:hypothetical protein
MPTIGYGCQAAKGDSAAGLFRKMRLTLVTYMTDQRGVALLEFSLVAPILVIFVVSIVDLGRALNFYMYLTRLSYEGTRYASAITGLETGECITPLHSVSCPGRPLHALVAARLQPLTTDGPVQPEAVLLRTTLFNSTYPFPGLTGQDEVVEVIVRAQFEPIFPTLFFLRNMSARTVGPHARVGGP